MGHVRGLALFLAVISIGGCASSSAVETQIQQLRAEMNNRMSSRDAGFREEMKKEAVRSEERTRKDQSDLEDRIRKDLGEFDGKNRKDLAELGKSVQGAISEIRETHRKYAVETDKTLLDQQKQIFQSKAVLDDNARRVYMLETIVTARSVVVPQQMREGHVTFVEGNKASVSLGNMNGVKVGDRFDVVKDNAKIGVIEIEAVERETSRGTILPESKKISIGDKVETEKKA